MTAGRRAAVLTVDDLTSAPSGSRLPGILVDLVKQPSGKWRRVDGNGNPIGSLMSSSTVASYDYLRYELRLPEGARR